MVNGSFIFSQKLNAGVKIKYYSSGSDSLFTNGRHFWFYGEASITKFAWYPWTKGGFYNTNGMNHCAICRNSLQKLNGC